MNFTVTYANGEATWVRWESEGAGAGAAHFTMRGSSAIERGTIYPDDETAAEVRAAVRQLPFVQAVHVPDSEASQP